MPADPPSPLTARLVALLDSDGRTQVQLAAAAGTAQSTIANLRAGRIPRVEVLVQLARALNVGPHTFGSMLYECFPAPDTVDS